MNRLRGLWRDTWWLWIAFSLLTLGISFAVGGWFLILLPCLPVPFVYFALARYDEDGNEKPDISD